MTRIGTREQNVLPNLVRLQENYSKIWKASHSTPLYIHIIIHIESKIMGGLDSSPICLVVEQSGLPSRSLTNWIEHQNPRILIAFSASNFPFTGWHASLGAYPWLLKYGWRIQNLQIIWSTDHDTHFFLTLPFYLYYKILATCSFLCASQYFIDLQNPRIQDTGWECLDSRLLCSPAEQPGFPNCSRVRGSR